MQKDLVTVFDQLTSKMNRNFLGFDNFFEQMKGFTSKLTSDGYPPYNVISIGDHATRLEFAVAGFSKQELSVALVNGVLTVSGNKNETVESDYYWKGISNRTFKHDFVISKDSEVSDVKLEDGILSIDVKMIVSEANDPKKFEIK